MEVIQHVTFIVLNVLFAILTLVGNSLILIAVYKTLSLRNTSNYLICSLAASGIVVGVFVNSNNAILTGSSLWHTTHPLRQAEQFFYVQTIVAITMNLCAVSIDRYIAIKHPLRYLAIMTSQKCFRVIVLIWGTSLVLGIPAGFLEGKRLFYLWAVVVGVGFCVPLLVIIVCYAEIMRIARIQQNQIVVETRLRNSFNSKEFRDKTARTIRSRRAAITFALITTVFIVTFAPDLILTIVKAIQGVQKAKHRSDMISKWLIFIIYTSSATNPIIYGFRSREYRVALKRILQFWKKKP